MSAISKRYCGDYCEGGLRALGCAVIHQAVEDYRTWERAGVIQSGQFCEDGWTRYLITRMRSGHHKLAVGYTCRQQITRLLNFFRRDLDEVMEEYGITMNPSAVRDRLGMVGGRNL